MRPLTPPQPILSMHYYSKKSLGFTLVEIMIVVVIIGLLAAIAIPAMQKVRLNAAASRIANDFRVFAGAFEMHILENGAWPEDGNSNNLPSGIAEDISSSWRNKAPNGGYWDWEMDRFGYHAAVGLSDEGTLQEAFNRVDDILDDGNLGSGRFVLTGNRYLYVLEK